MPTLTPSWTITHPAYIENEIIMQQNQASGAFATLEGGNPRVKIGSEDKYVYMKRLSVRTKVRTNQAAANQLPSVSIAAQMINVPTYVNRVRAEYDHHDTAMAAEWGFNIVDAQRLGMRQGHFQLLRLMLLTGNKPSNGEGLLNTPGATLVALPPDSLNMVSVRTYDNGQMAQFFLGQMLAMQIATMNLGLPAHFVVLGPMRTLGQFEWPNIVQLVSYQRPGAGSSTTVGVIKDIAGLNGCTVEWTYDDTLANQSAAGVDTVLLVRPEIKIPEGTPNTNEFAKLTPGQRANTIMYQDMAAPKEIPTPLPGGAIDIMSELRASPGWVLRPEAVRILTMTY